MNESDENVLVLIKENLLPGEKLMLFGPSRPHTDMRTFFQAIAVVFLLFFCLIFLLLKTIFGVFCSIVCIALILRAEPSSINPRVSHYALTSDRLIAVKESVFTIAVRDEVLKIRTQNDIALLQLPTGKVKFKYFRGIPEITG